ncbi:hypothetical protein GBF38_003456 [Nibea albiflora]|uniref:Uncharacterized protein n=1 Tax=Nibea albiflora TaxID=240163 RepID=A0ACB7FKY9_NIBAL|nr:hypothetical protein GBF38_003456 [Nibea albiflora]
MKRTLLLLFLIILSAEMILGESRPSSPTQLIQAEVHDNVTLQCPLDSRVNMEKYTIVCERVDLKKIVHACRLQTSDSGPYRCFVPKQKPSCTFNLTVDGAHMKAVRAAVITTVVVALCVLVVVLVVKSGTIQDCLKRQEERDEDQERPLEAVV